MVAGWKKDCVGFHAVQQTFPRVHGGCGEWRAEGCGEADGGNEEFPAAVLLQRLRHGNQPGVDAGRERDSVRFELRTHLWNRGVLADQSGTGSGGSGDSLRGNELEGAAGLFAGWLADGVQLVSGKAMAQLVADACEWRRCVPDYVRGLGSDECQVVARRQFYRFYIEQKRIDSHSLAAFRRGRG